MNLPSPIAIIGLGLIGGSLGFALKGKTEIIGYSPRRETVSLALSKGAIDKGARDLREAIERAELIILSTPILAIKGILSQISPFLKEGAIITDTASTKVEVMKWAKEFLPQGSSFIGGHPMAGRERWGIEMADAELFRGAIYCLTPSSQSSSQDLDKVIAVVKGIGASPFIMKAEEHDYLVAGISHLPIVISTALIRLIAKSPYWDKMAWLAAGGFRDLTRLASGNPRMSTDICLTNKVNISLWVEGFIKELGDFLQLMKEDEIESVFDWAWEVREKWLKGKGWK